MTPFKRFLKSGVMIQCCFFVSFGFAQSAQSEASLHEIVQQRTDDIFESLIEIHRDLHMNPELSEKEELTSKKIEEYLRSFGLDVETNIGGYGVVGILNGNKKGKRIAWRAEIDAMPSDIPDVVDFESKKKGVRHICGHDVHTTIGLGIANILAGQKEKINGTVYFIFQPSEENYKGAKAMIASGLFDKIHPDELYGLHISPWPVGTIATKSNAVYAHARELDISYRAPLKKDSVISFTKELVSGFQNIGPESKYWDLNSLGDPNIGLESPNTIFNNYLTVKKDFNIQDTNKILTVSASINSSDEDQLEALKEKLEQKIRGSVHSEIFEGIEYSYEKTVIMNDEDLTSETLDIISAIYGEESVLPVYGVIPQDRGDDFAYFQERIPGVYYFLGGSNYEKGIISMPHSPGFAVDEESIRFGVNYFSSMIIERLNQ